MVLRPYPPTMVTIMFRRQLFPHPHYDERGAATAEFAVALPAVISVFLVMLLLSLAGAVKVQACDQARSAAREIALSPPGTTVEASGFTITPSISKNRVSVRATPSGIRALLPFSSTLSCSATTIREDIYD